MRLRKTENELILRDKPGCLWIFGLFFILVSSVFVYGALGGFTDYDRIPDWAISFSFFMGAIGIAVGVWQISSHPLSKIVINRKAKTVVFTQRGLFKKTNRVFRFEEVQKFAVKEGEDDESNAIWKTELSLTSGETVEITSVWERKEKECEYAAETANNFLRK